MQQSTYRLTGVSIAASGRRLVHAWRAVRDVIAAVDRTLALWDLRARSRRDLARLDDHLMRDMGFDPIEARREANKPFWRR